MMVGLIFLDDVWVRKVVVKSRYNFDLKILFLIKEVIEVIVEGWDDVGSF